MAVAVEGMAVAVEVAVERVAADLPVVASADFKI